MAEMEREIAIDGDYLQLMRCAGNGRIRPF